MSTNFNTCFIDSNGRDVSEEFVEKSYLLDVYPSLINQAKAPSLWTWGAAAFLGNNTSGTIYQSSPVQTVSGGTNWKQVSVGLAVGAIKSDGTLWQWGAAGSLGDNTNIPKSSPVQTISGGTNWSKVSSKWCHTAAIKTDGSLWLWGNGNLGQLGNNGTVNNCRSSPVQTVSGGTNWKQVSAGGQITGAIKTDGTLWVFGNGTNGQMGDNTAVGKSSPVQTVSGGTNWKQVGAGYLHVLAIKKDGTLWGWGCGGDGELGNNSIADRSSPVQTISGGTNWKQVSAGSAASAAIKTDGTLWIWGCNTGGRLGDNTVLNRSSPVQTVSGGNNWKCVDIGYITTAIKTDGTLWLWGCGQGGGLGNHAIENRSSPVQTISGGTNWKQVAAQIHAAGTSQFYGTSAIREEGDW